MTFIQKWQKWDVGGWQRSRIAWPLYALAMIALLTVLLLPARAQQSKTWFYVATAVDSLGNESAFSNEVSATVSGAHPTVDLSWIASVTPTVTYNVYRTAVSGSGYVKINTSPITVLSFTDTTAFPSPPTMNKPVVP